MPRKTDSSNPADWLYFAASDLEGIRHLVEDEVAYALCASKLAEVFEKVLKAELIRQGWFLVRTHDLPRLARELHGYDPAFAACVRPLCEALAEKYMLDRYPGFDLEDPDWPELRAHVGAVAEVLAAVELRMEQQT